MRRKCCLASTLLVLGATLMASAPPAGAQTPPSRDIIIPSTMQGTLICATGDTLCLSGPDALRDFAFCLLSADRHPVPEQQHNYDPLSPRYAFRWTADTPGTHRLTLDYVLENRTLVNSRRFVVQTQDKPPVVLPPLPTQFYGAAAGKDLPVTVEAVPEFHAAQVDFFLDGQEVGTVTQSPFAYTLPLGGTLTGPHSVFVEATDGSGAVYISPVQTVTVAAGKAPGAAPDAPPPPAKAHKRPPPKKGKKQT